MTDTQKGQMRQIAANLLSTINSISGAAKSVTLSLNVDAAQVNISLQSLDTSLPSGTGVQADTLVCKFADLPPAA